MGSRPISNGDRAFLTKANGLLTSSLEPGEMLATVAKLAVPDLADWCLIHTLDRDGVATLSAFEHTNPAHAELARELLAKPIHRVLCGGSAELQEIIADETLNHASSMIVPLRGRERVVGAMTFVSSDSKRQYTLHDLAVVEDLASRAGLALENAFLFISALRAAERTSRLQKFTDALAKAVTTEEVARSLVRAGLAALGASAGSAWLLRADGSALDLLTSENCPVPPDERPSSIPINDPMPICDAVRTRKLLTFSSSLDLERHYPKLPLEALAIMPFILGERSIGGVAFSFDVTRKFTDDDNLLLASMAGQATMAFERCRLFESERAARERARRLLAVTTQLSRTLPIDEVTRVVLEEGTAAVGADAGAIWVLDLASQELKMVASRGRTEELDFFKSVPLELQTPIGESVRIQRPVWNETEAEGIGFACLPLLVEDRALGVLFVSFRAGHVFDEDERTFLGVLSDNCAQALERANLIARERAAMDDTRDAYEAAQSADRRKDEFLAMLGHELRNPLAPIVTALHLIHLRGDSSSERELAVIERQVNHLTSLVDDLLDVSRITRGKIALAAEPVDLGEAIAKAVEMASPLFERHRHYLSLDIAKDGLYVRGDGLRLAQVIANLLTNAAKYSEPGGQIEVIALRSDCEVEVRVRDNGIGIPPDLLPHIFELFIQGRRTSDRAHGGLGLGLALVKSLVDRHGGTVAASSDGLGCGSEFVVRLPALIGDPPPLLEVQPNHTLVADGHARRVLIVDDNRDAAEILAEALRAQGHSVEVVFEPIGALERARARPPDVAILDIGLPVMDGYELASRLREQGTSAPLVAVTGYGQDSDRARARSCGFAAHFVKPVDLEDLCRTISALE